MKAFRFTTNLLLITAMLVCVSQDTRSQTTATVPIAPAQPPPNEPSTPPIPPEGTRKETYLGKELSITTTYVNLSKGEKRLVKLDHRFGGKFENLRDTIDTGAFTQFQSKNQAQFIGKGEGTGEVVVFDADSSDTASKATRFVVFVSKSEFTQTLDAIRQLVGDVEGLEVKVVGNKIVLDGEILVPSEFKRVLRVWQSYADTGGVQLYATLSPLALEMIAKRIAAEINDLNVTVRVLNGSIVMEGNVDSPQTVERYLSIAKSFIPEKVAIAGQAGGVSISPPAVPAIISLLTVASQSAPEPEKMIRITVHYAEVASDYLNNFNFKWSPTLGVTPTIKYQYNSKGASSPSDPPNGLTTSIIATIDSLIPKFLTSRGHSHARILKTSSLLVKNKDELGSTVSSQLLVPYRVVTNTPQGTTVSEDVTAVTNSTTITAQVLPGKNTSQKEMLELGINIKLTNLTAAPGGQRPQTSENAVNTRVVIANGEAVAIGGLINDSQTAGYNKSQPGEAPTGTPIFNISRSKDYTHAKGQFVIFVTPEVLDNPAAGTDEIKRKFRLRRGVSNDG